MSSGVVTLGGVALPNNTDTLLGSFLTTSGNGSTVVGSSGNGVNVFDGALLGTTFTAQSGHNTLSYGALPLGPGVTVNLTTDRVSGSSPTQDSFNFAPGALTVQGSQNADSFIVGTSTAVLQGGGGHDSLDLSSVPAPASGTTGVSADLNAGSVTGPTIGGVTFVPVAPWVQTCALPR